MVRFRLATLCFLFFLHSAIFAQTSTLCAYTFIEQLDRPDLSITNLNLECRFEDNEYAFRKVDKLMNLAGLPMNFSVCKQGKFDNAYAFMDSSGTRFIIYDQAFLQKLDGSKSNLESVTILAHEIGHHLAAHTISLNEENFIKARRLYCDSFSKDYNQKRCKLEEQNYLEIRRQQELEADRFAGYIMQKYGASIGQISSVYNQLFTNNNSQITHPALERRLQALKDGFELATQKKDEGQHVSLQEIKGSPFILKVNNADRIARNKLIGKVMNAAGSATNVITREYPYSYGFVGFTNRVEISSEIRNYLGGRSAQNSIDTDDEYFSGQFFKYIASQDPRINFGALAGFHIQNNVLKILIFNGGAKPQIVYSSPFSKEKISLEEITITFVTIFRNSIEQAIKAINK